MPLIFQNWFTSQHPHTRTPFLSPTLPVLALIWLTPPISPLGNSGKPTTRLQCYPVLQSFDRQSPPPSPSSPRAPPHACIVSPEPHGPIHPPKERAEADRETAGKSRGVCLRRGGRAPEGGRGRSDVRDFCGPEARQPSSQDAARRDKAGKEDFVGAIIVTCRPSRRVVGRIKPSKTRLVSCCSNRRRERRYLFGIFV